MNTTQKLMSVEKFRNLQQEQTNLQLKQLIRQRWLTHILPNSTGVANQFTEEDDILYLDQYYVNKNLSNRIFANTKYPDQGITAVVITTKNGKQYFTYSICSLLEKSFSKKLGVYYALRNVLKLGVMHFDFLFPNVDFKGLAAKSSITVNELFVKNLSYYLATGKNRLCVSELSQVPTKQLKEHENLLFSSLHTQVSKQAQEENLKVEFQFVHVRPAYFKGNPVLTTTSLMQRYYQEDEQFKVNSKGGMTIFAVTLTDNVTGDRRVITSYALCSPKDVFSKTAGRLFAISKLAKSTPKNPTSYCLEIEAGADSFEHLINFYQTLTGKQINH